jgi:hypothetical protein
VLKKAGIVVAAATAGLLAVSPMAFAGGLISIDDNVAQVPVQACGNDILSGVVGILAKDQENSSDDDVDCDQDTSAEYDGDDD